MKTLIRLRIGDEAYSLTKGNGYYEVWSTDGSTVGYISLCDAIDAFCMRANLSGTCYTAFRNECERIENAPVESNQETKS